jgi:hypothetical protein
MCTNPGHSSFHSRATSCRATNRGCHDYVDYLFIAFTTNFAFSPTDALPLTRTAKMLMMVQAAISVVTLTGIAGAAINILAGKA